MLNDSSKTNTSGVSSPLRGSKLPWGLPTAALVLLGFWISQFIAGIVVFLLPTLLGKDSIARDEWLINSPYATFLLIIIYQALALGGLIWFFRRKRISLKDTLGFYPPRLSDVGYMVAGAVVYYVGFVIILTILQAVTQINTEQEQAIGFHSGQGLVGLILAFLGLVVLTPIFEETIFRGFLYTTLRARGWQIAWSTLTTSLIFASLHLLGAADGGLLWVAFVDTFLLSLVLCYVREHTGRLWASIGIHAIKNGIAFLSLFILTS